MTLRLSHRRRLVLSAASASGLILAALFVAASFLYRQFEVIEEFDSLSPTARQAMQAAIQGDASSEAAAICAAEPTVSLAISRKNVLLAQGGPLNVSELEGQGRSRVNGVEVTRYSLRQRDYHVVAARPWGHREEAAQKFAKTLALLWFPLVGLIAGATAIASRATFRPLDDMRRQADAARKGGLQGRLRVEGQDEYGEFAASLNGFLDRIAVLVASEEQFVADAAHELRTPLTALRGRVETTLLRERRPEEYRQALGIVLDEAERLSALVEALLNSATASAAKPTAPLDLRDEIERAQARWIDRFTEAGVVLDVSAPSLCAGVLPSEIGSVLDNLLANALRASPSGTICRIELRPFENVARLAVQDAGPGVPEELRERIFDRFVRGEESRNRATGGFGIGLSLCRRIVEGRGGRIRVVPTERGARFEVDLPRA